MSLLREFGALALYLGVDELVLRVRKQSEGKDALMQFMATVKIPDAKKEAVYTHAVEVADAAFREGTVMENFVRRCREELAPYQTGGIKAAAIIIESAKPAMLFENPPKDSGLEESERACTDVPPGTPPANPGKRPPDRPVTGEKRRA